MFWKKRKVMEFDRENEKPVIHASICTGEKSVGFKNLKTGSFSEIMLIRDEKDLDKFMKTYGISREEITKEY